MGEESRFDVVVGGAGGSGLAAAVSAAEGGARVVALERREEPGGTTSVCPTKANKGPESPATAQRFETSSKFKYSIEKPSLLKRSASIF